VFPRNGSCKVWLWFVVAVVCVCAVLSWRVCLSLLVVCCQEDQPLGLSAASAWLSNGSSYDGPDYSGLSTHGADYSGLMNGDGCAWKRRPAARVFWGSDLKDAGWNFTNVQDTPKDISHSRQNKARFKKMVTEDGPGMSTASRFMSRRCCGC
jgi:hypothetical protein